MYEQMIKEILAHTSELLSEHKIKQEEQRKSMPLRYIIDKVLQLLFVLLLSSILVFLSIAIAITITLISVLSLLQDLFYNIPIDVYNKYKDR